MKSSTGILLLAAGAAAIVLGGRKRSAAAGTKDGIQTASFVPGVFQAPVTATIVPGTLQAAASTALCKRPKQLTLAEQSAIMDQVIAPLFDELAADLPAQPTPTQLDAKLAKIGRAAAAQCSGGKPSQASVAAATTIARALWWKRSGQSGL
jgi:hypothetical protein